MSHSTHDIGYKLLYAHEALVRDLLTGFIPGDWVRELDLATLERCSGSYVSWVRELDLATLERCSGSYVSDDLRDRADDLIWRVRWGRGWLYVYLLLEFQRACAGVDIVLHQAALGSVPRSIGDPLTTNAANIDGLPNTPVAARCRCDFSRTHDHDDRPGLPKHEDLSCWI